MSEPLRIGLLGHGTVGSAFAALLDERAAEIERFNGRAPVITGVLTRSRGYFAEILAEADLIVELIGGTEPAREYLLAAMRAGRDVVSANKQLLSQHGEELFEVAREHDVRLRFEAAVAGAVPVVRVLEESLAVDADRAHPRDRQRHHQLHPLRDGRRQHLRAGARRGSAPGLRRGRPHATTSPAATPRRRWRSSRAWPSARPCAWRTFPTRASSTWRRTTWSTPASSASG